MRAFINGMGNISPQQTWNDETVLTQGFDYRGTQLTCVEPDYEQWIDPRQLRRMSRIIRMGVTAARMALQDAGVENPDGIITGTGYGCLEDTGSFLTKMVENKEDALNPTPFIQSTHNTIGSQIALLLQCQEYNQTFAHSAFSFEHALLDALLQLAENPSQRLLVGGVDEATSVSHAIQQRFGIFRRRIISTLNLFRTPPAKGTVNGEGAAYFVLSGIKNEQTHACVEGVRMFYKPGPSDLKEGIRSFVGEAGLKPGAIDLVLCGKSGDKRTDKDVDTLCQSLFPSSAVGLYKHLCGEYPVASAFAVWLGTRILMEHHIPEVVVYRDASRPVRNVLIYNPYFGTHHSVILLKSCRGITL